MYVVGASLSVGSRVNTKLIFSLLVAGFSLAPSFAALVPAVPRDAHSSVAAGKRTTLQFIHFFIDEHLCYFQFRVT